MPVEEKRTFSVTPVSVGRKDYSANVEQSVEPLILSWQQEYKAYKEITVNANTEVTTEVEIEAATVVIVYDFYLSTYSNVLLDARLDFLEADGVTWSPFAAKWGTRTVEIHITRGWPLFKKYRITIKNWDPSVNADCTFTSHGIVTSETVYYGRMG